MSGDKVKYTALKRATVHVDNSVDTEKVYDIEAEVNVTSLSVDSFEQGIVRKDNSDIATFSCYGENNLNISYQNVDSENQCAVLEAVNAFMQNTKEKFQQTNPISLANL